MKVVTSAEFRAHLNEIYQTLEEDDIIITRHGEVVAVVVHPSRMELKKKEQTWRQQVATFLEQSANLLRG